MVHLLTLVEVSSAYINPSNLSNAFPFFGNVKDVPSFDAGAFNYFSDVNQFKTTKFINQLSCYNASSAVIRWERTVLCSQWVNERWSAQCLGLYSGLTKSSGRIKADSTSPTSIPTLLFLHVRFDAFTPLPTLQSMSGPVLLARFARAQMDPPPQPLKRWSANPHATNTPTMKRRLCLVDRSVLAQTSPTATAHTNSTRTLQTVPTGQHSRLTRPTLVSSDRAMNPTADLEAVPVSSARSARGAVPKPAATTVCLTYEVPANADTRHSQH